MYKCKECKRVSKLKEKMYRKVVEKIDREYLNKDGEVVGTGWEIKKEISVCASCFEKGE